MIAIVDYGMGNLRSVSKAFEKVGFPGVVTQDSSLIEKADGLVLPGVGAFKKAMENLEHLRLIDPILAFLQSGKPFLGICLGLQLLFSESEEFSSYKGLGVFKGKVIRFPFSLTGAPPVRDSLKVPHMGWNSVWIKSKTPALERIQEGTYFYFVHSFFPVPDDPEIITTTTDYGGEFVSSVGKGNLFACQFHPEKSQSAGLQIVQNFGRLVQP
jgi:imidazole glycerol-phosphate synthase subunit HisH